MDKITDETKAPGLDESFVPPEAGAQFPLARVSSVHKDMYTVNAGSGDVLAEISGRMFANAASVFDYPVVGDWVRVELHNAGTLAIIHAVAERKSLLKRKAAGRKVDFQLIAANIDTAFVVQSLNADFNVRRLERYMVMINESRIRPAVLLSKCDLVPAEEAAARMAEIAAVLPGVAVETFSSLNEDGVAKVRALLEAGKTYCLLGSSGVGKTTLLNGLIGKEAFATKEIRDKDDRGRHATTTRQLIRLDCGAMIIDTPGMRELGNFDIQAGLDETFADIKSLAAGCKFGDCTHSHEKGCAVTAAIKDGTLDEERYRNYLKMNKEAAYNAMSYLDKRRKDKQFGKMCKEVLKTKLNRK